MATVEGEGSLQNRVGQRQIELFVALFQLMEDQVEHLQRQVEYSPLCLHGRAFASESKKHTGSWFRKQLKYFRRERTREEPAWKFANIGSWHALIIAFAF